jgi:hypothetical protein
MFSFDTSARAWKRMRDLADEMADAEASGRPVDLLDAEYRAMEREFNREI